MSAAVQSPAIYRLREQIQRLEGTPLRARTVLPFGVPAIDERLPGGGRLGRCTKSPAVVCGDRRGGGSAVRRRSGGPDPRQGALVRHPAGSVAPALAQVGLGPDRVIYVDACDEKSVLACFEEGVRHGGLGAVVAEVARLSMTSSRRLSLAAEASGSMAIAIRRWRRQTEAADFGQSTASATRWRVSALPSAPLPVPGVGRPRWLLELIRCGAGESADFLVGACDAEARLDIPADMADRSAPAQAGRRSA